MLIKGKFLLVLMLLACVGILLFSFSMLTNRQNHRNAAKSSYFDSAAAAACSEKQAITDQLRTLEQSIKSNLMTINDLK